MEDEGDYDEFGNYIGDPQEQGEEEGLEWEEETEGYEPDDMARKENPYDEDVEVLVEDEDELGLEDGVIRGGGGRASYVDFARIDGGGSVEPLCRDTYLQSLFRLPGRMRALSLVGTHGTGKTALADMLLEHSRVQPSRRFFPRHTDRRFDERARGLSLELRGLTVAHSDAKGRTVALQVLDCPGHVDFLGETAAARPLVDGTVLVVDALEGPAATAGLAVQAAVRKGRPLVLCLNKLDRVMLEARLPPEDAYQLLCAHMARVQALWNEAWALQGDGTLQAPRLSPALGNVVFASASLHLVLSLPSVARASLKNEAFAERLWGDVWMDPATRRFVRRPVSPTVPRSFVQWVLQPLYTLVACTVGGEWAKLPWKLGSPFQRLPIRQQLRQVFALQFGSPCTPLVQSIVDHIPPFTSFPQNSDFPEHDSTRLCVHVSKLEDVGDGKTFDAIGRVVRGSLRVKDAVLVSEDAAEPLVGRVEKLRVPHPFRNIELEEAPVGTLVSIRGLGELLSKSAVLHGSPQSSSSVPPLAPLLRFETPALMKVAVEPLRPSELPRLVDGLRRLAKAYPQLQSTTEASGERQLVGTGELFLDAALADLRGRFGEGLEVRVSEPLPCLAESVLDASAFRCGDDARSGSSHVFMVAEPLDASVVRALDRGLTPSELDLRQLHGWDARASRHMWAFAASQSSALSRDVLAGDVSAARLRELRSGVEQGFRWAVRAGPLCDEPVRGAHLRLVGVEWDGAPQAIIPRVRRAAHAALLAATPRLMEPVLAVHATAPDALRPVLEALLERRRGRLVAERPMPATPLREWTAMVPLADAFGLETDLRARSLGLVAVQAVVDHWDLVPGNPLDSSIVLKPLSPAPLPHLARDFLVKSRRRKGLSEDILFDSFFSSDQKDQLL